MTRSSQGKGLTVTSACDLGEACYLALFLLHAVMAKGWHSNNRLTHAPTSIIAFRRSARSTTVEVWRVFYAPPGVAVLNWTINSGGGKTPPYGCRPFGSFSHLVTIVMLNP